MPLSSKRNLTHYEPKRKNPITLGDDSNIDKNLKVIKVDSKNSILELSDNELKVRGTIDASAITVDGASVQTGTDAGATELNELSDVTYSSGDLTITDLDTIVAGGSLTLDVVSSIVLNSDSGSFSFKDDTVTLASFAAGTFNFSYDGSNYLRLIVSSAGVVTFRTAGGTATDADIILDAGGDIDLDSGTGNFIASKGGTEFSAANSAYAGMILGYTRLEGDLTSQNVFEIQNDITVEDATHKVTF